MIQTIQILNKTNEQIVENPVHNCQIIINQGIYDLDFCYFEQRVGYSQNEFFDVQGEINQIYVLQNFYDIFKNIEIKIDDADIINFQNNALLQKVFSKKQQKQRNFNGIVFQEGLDAVKLLDISFLKVNSDYCDFKIVCEQSQQNNYDQVKIMHLKDVFNYLFQKQKYLRIEKQMIINVQLNFLNDIYYLVQEDTKKLIQLYQEDPHNNAAKDQVIQYNFSLKLKKIQGLLQQIQNNNKVIEIVQIKQNMFYYFKKYYKLNRIGFFMIYKALVGGIFEGDLQEINKYELTGLNNIAGNDVNINEQLFQIKQQQNILIEFSNVLQYQQIYLKNQWNQIYFFDCDQNQVLEISSRQDMNQFYHLELFLFIEYEKQ